MFNRAKNKHFFAHEHRREDLRHVSFSADEREDTGKQKLESNWKRHQVDIKTDRAAIWGSSLEL